MEKNYNDGNDFFYIQFCAVIFFSVLLEQYLIYLIQQLKVSIVNFYNRMGIDIILGIRLGIEIFDYKNNRNRNRIELKKSSNRTVLWSVSHIEWTETHFHSIYNLCTEAGFYTPASLLVSYF